MRDRLTTHLFSWLSKRDLATLHRLGTVVGWFLYVLPTDARRTTDHNLRLCLPDLSDDARAQLARRSLAESAKAILEMPALWSWSREQFEASIRGATGVEELRAALATGHGAIIAAPHLGAWEVSGLFCSLLGQITSLYRPPKIAALGAWARRGREHLGAHLVPVDSGGVRALLTALKKQHMVGILPDQDAGRDGGIFAPFFGVPASTMTLLTRLAQKTDCPIFLMHAERLRDGTGFWIHCRRADADVSDEDLEVAVRALNRGVERMVRERIEQYLWSYKRFKTKPPPP